MSPPSSTEQSSLIGLGMFTTLFVWSMLMLPDQRLCAVTVQTQDATGVEESVGIQSKNCSSHMRIVSEENGFVISSAESCAEKS